MALRLYLDSADPADWRQWLPTGLFHGVTTNPTLLKRAGQPCDLTSLRALSQQAMAHGVRELHLQAWGVICSAAAAPWPIWLRITPGSSCPSPAPASRLPAACWPMACP